MTRIIIGLLVILSGTNVNGQGGNQTDMINLIPGLDIEARIGLGLVTSMDKPTAVTAFMRNDTNKTIEGRLEVFDRWQGSRLNLGEIFLAPNQVRRFCAIKNFENWGSPVLELVSNGQSVWQQPLNQYGYSNTNEQGFHKVAILHDGTTEHQFRLALPVNSTVTTIESNSRYGWQDSVDIGFTEAGYEISTSNIRTWQIPDHLAPLEPLRAMIAIESVDPDKLNGAQVTAIANWITTGGTFYVPSQSEELFEKIKQALPFAISPANVENTLAIRKCGLGKIILYPNTLFGDSTLAAEETIYRSIAALPRQVIPSSASVELLHRQPSYGRNATRVSIMGYFFGYLILSVVPIVFVTTKLKRKVLPYTVGLVGIGCLAAAVLGATLRNSTGESRWLTLTVPGENGGIQFADIEVRSTGGIASTVSVAGQKPDLQAGSPSPRYYHYYGSQNNSGMAFEGFDWRANEVEADDRYQLQADITPWGTRRLRATDFNPDITAPDVELKLAGKYQGNYSESSIRVRNTGNMTINNLHLVVHVSPQNNNSTSPSSAAVKFANLTPKQEIQRPIRLNLGQLASEVRLGEQFAELTLQNRIAPNQTRAFLVGTIDQSPRLALEEQCSDFEVDHEGHLWMYEIPAEQIQIGKQ